MDFEKVKHHKLKMYPQNEWVDASDFDALLSEMRETRRALEMAVQEVGKGKFLSGLTSEEWISEARSELAKESATPSTCETAQP